jgi:hypothetical protein
VNSIAARWGRSSSRVRAGLAAVALAAAVLLTALAPAAASAGGAQDSIYGPSMSLSFVGASARLVGTGAVVSVRCAGSRRGSCAGTVSLRFAGSTHKVAFSVAGGRRQNLVVPLGADRGRIGKHRVRAVARTVQPLGSCRESRRLLRLR